MFPYHRPETSEMAPTLPDAPANAEASPVGPEPVPQPRRWSNRAVALTLLILMATMAVVGLTFVQMTTHVRREQDVELPKRQPFVVPVLARTARLIYVGAIALYVLNCLRRRDRIRSLGGRIGAGVLLALLALLMVEDVSGLVGGPSVLVPPRFRQRGQSPPQQAQVTVPAVAPAELTGLGYLPADTNLIVGVHIAEAWRDPTGREFLSRFRFGTTNFGIQTLEKWTGLKLDEIDHAVLGLRIDENLLPRVTLVVRTQQPYNEEQVRTALKAGGKRERKKKAIYSIQVEQLNLALWCVDERTLIIGLTPLDLDDVPLQPSDNIDRLPAELVGVMQERLTRGTQAWAVAHAKDWNKTLARLALQQLDKEAQAHLAKVQTLAVWLQFDQGLGLNAALRCKDEASAREFDQYLGKSNVADRLLRVFGNRPEAEAVSKELAATLTRQQKGTWVDAQARVAAAAVQQAFAQPQ
jgi:hypothetical protein